MGWRCSNINESSIRQNVEKEIEIGNNIRITNSRTEIPIVVQNDINTLQKWGDRVDDVLEEKVTPTQSKDGEGFEVVSKSQKKKLRQKHQKSSPNVMQTRGRAASLNIVQ